MPFDIVSMEAALAELASVPDAAELCERIREQVTQGWTVTLPAVPLLTACLRHTLVLPVLPQRVATPMSPL